jgi:hypothetical protein
VATGLGLPQVEQVETGQRAEWLTEHAPPERRQGRGGQTGRRRGKGEGEGSGGGGGVWGAASHSWCSHLCTTLYAL